MDGTTSFLVDSIILAVLGWIILSTKKQDTKHPELYIIFRIFFYVGVVCAIIAIIIKVISFLS
jgi:hypothetical protein